MTVLSFEVPGIPQPMQRPRLGANGNIYTPRKTLGFEHAVATYALSKMRAAGWSVRGTGRYAVAIRAFFPDARRRDLDNVLKSSLDGCTPLVWADDSQVDEVHMWRGVDARRPRVEIEIRRLEVEASIEKSDRDARKTTPSETGGRCEATTTDLAEPTRCRLPAGHTDLHDDGAVVFTEPAGPSRARVQPTTEGTES